MRKDAFHAVTLFLLCSLALLIPVQRSEAAPGDFLFLWGAQQHLTGASGLSVDASGNVFVTDTDNVQVFNCSGIRIKKWGSYGSGDGQFSYPNGISVDATGKVYVADTGNDRIEVFDTNGKFLFKWGHPDWAVHPPIEVASDGKGTVYVLEAGSYDAQYNYSDGTIKVFDAAGKFLRQLGSIGSGNGQFSRAAGIALDANGNVYVIDNGNGRIDLFTPSGAFSKVAVNLQGFFGAGIAVDLSGNILVAGSFPFQFMVRVYDAAGNILRDVRYLSEPIYKEHYWQPKTVAVDRQGNIYTLDGDNDGLRAFDSTGNPLSQWWTYGVGQGQMSKPTWLATDKNGNVYETDALDTSAAIINDRVQLFSGSGKSLAKWTGAFCQTAGLVVQADGKVDVLNTANPEWSSCQPSSVALVFDSAGKVVGQWGTPRDFFGIAIDAAGNFLVTDTKNSFVLIYDPAGNQIGYFGGQGSGVAQFSGPQGITVDAAGNIYVVDTGNSRVQVFDSRHRWLRKWGAAGTGNGQFSNPVGIAVDGSGHVFVADSGNNRVQVLDSNGVFLKAWGSAGDENGLFNAPQGIIADCTGTKIYVADTGNNRIQVFEGFGSVDSVAPVVTAFAIPATSTSLTVPITTFSATDNVSVTGYLVSESATPPAASDSRWSDTKPADFTFTSTGAKTLYAFVKDGVGNVSSSLSATVTIGDPLPSPWQSQDIGSVGKSGRAGFMNNIFTLVGAGSDIWGTSDSFRYVYKSMTGDGQIVAWVGSLQNTNSYAKAGVMMRQSLAANSIHAMMDLTPVNGAEFSRRTSSGGSTNVTGIYGMAAPYWVKLVRKGNVFTGYISTDGVSWRVVAGDTIAMTGTIYVGLVVTSHDPSVLCTATMSFVTTPVGDVAAPQITAFTIPATSAGLGVPITALTATDDTGVTGYLVTESSTTPSASGPGWSATAPAIYTFGSAGAKTLYAWAKDAAGNVSASSSATVTITLPATGLPTPWLTQDIGSVGLSGSASYLNGLFTLRGAGSDIWGSSDSFRFVYKPVTGDTEIVARVVTQQNTSNFAKAGVMIRQALTPDSAQVMMDVTPGNGTEFSRRTTVGGSTTVTAPYWVTTPYWVRLVRSGNTFTGYVSSDGSTWSPAGSDSVTMTGTVYVGLVVTSHDTGVLGTTTMDQVK